MIKSLGWWCRVAAASCVALAAVGLTSGAHAQQKLKIYVSTGFDGNTWIQEAKLVESDAVNGDGFGRSVSLYGNRALIGAWA